MVIMTVPIRVVTEDEDDSLISELGGLGIQFKQPTRNLSTRTSTEIPFEGDHLSVKLNRYNSPIPPAPTPPSTRKHKKRVSTSRPLQFSPTATDMHLFEGGETWEDIEETEKPWIIPMDGNSQCAGSEIDN
jgi:hypothetical protein